MKTTPLKPSLKRISDVGERLKQQRAEKLQLLVKMRQEMSQIKSMLSHLQMKNRFVIKEEYVHNMMDSVLQILRQYLQEELNVMLRGGKNESNRQYVRVRNELIVVDAELEKRMVEREEDEVVAKAA